MGTLNTTRDLTYLGLDGNNFLIHSFCVLYVVDILLPFLFALAKTGELFVTLVCMLTWEELEVGEMILNPSHTHLFFFSGAACLGKDTRLIYFGV
jgi:hypothetical protein